MMNEASPIAEKRVYAYLRVSDPKGKHRKKLEEVAQELGDHLYEHEKEPVELLRLLMIHAATCIKAIRPEPILKDHKAEGSADASQIEKDNL